MGAVAGLFLGSSVVRRYPGSVCVLIVFFAPGGLAGHLAAKTSTTGIEEG
jgi:hypothetical protein